VTSIAEDLKSRIDGGQARVGVLGLGYVGLPLCVEFASGGLAVIGFDLSEEKVGALNRGEAYIQDVAGERREVAANFVVHGQEVSFAVGG